MATITNTSTKEIDAIMATARKTFSSGVTRELAWRRNQLKALIRMLDEGAPELRTALNKDLGVNAFFTDCIELHMSSHEAKLALQHLDEWTSPRSVSTPLLNLPASSSIVAEPHGVVLIITPWNYPVSLMLAPLAAAIAAGNVVVIKPSELSVATSLELERLCKKYLDPSAIFFVQGDKDPTTALLKHKFDFIMYTGNGRVARIIYAAAAVHLTPVLLELGGKSPAIIDSSADLPTVIKRIVWGKYSMNMGQTCITPDYILTTPDMESRVIAELVTTIKAFFPSPDTNKDVSRMISVAHAQRVAAMLDDPEVTVEHGGQHDTANRYIAPTVVRATPKAKCMQSEIFGPILPVLTVPTIQAAIDFVNQNDKPLAMYIFSSNKANQDQIISQTSAGGVTINDTIMHAANPCLPFGGVGESGIGSYHGKFGFDAFSHLKPVLKKFGTDPSLRFPPYTDNKITWLKRLNNIELPNVPFQTLLTVLLAIACVILAILLIVD